MLEMTLVDVITLFLTNLIVGAGLGVGNYLVLKRLNK